MYLPASIITVENVAATLEDGLRALASGQEKFDFAEVTTVDSTAVAALLAWQRSAIKQGKALAFVHLPDNLKSLINLYGVASLLQPVPQPEPRSDLPHH